MKHRILGLIALFLIFKTPVYACDVCNIFEYKPFNTNNYVGIFYHYKKFNGYNDLKHSNSFFATRKQQMHELDGSNLFFEKRKEDYEQYTTVALRANWTVFEKWNVLMILPYETAEVYYNKIWDFIEPVSDTTLRVSGFGDITSAFDRSFTINTAQRKHIFRPGFAIKWPTGAINKSNANGEVYDPQLQMGTGSLDFIFRVNYLNIRSDGGMGYAAALNYKINGKGGQNYIFGDSWNTQFNALYVFQNPLKRQNLIPKLGFYAEGARRDRQEEQRIDYTGGMSLFMNLGVDLQRKNWSVQALYQKPIYQDRNGNQIGNAGRLNLSVIRSF